jgi:sigma-B regulation protein RsbU (phosphoserine phosphatase)
LAYSNAGHNAPVLLTATGIRRLEKGGVVLGVFEDAAFEQGALTLSPGDIVVAFSDGVTEARNQADEEFTDERLVRTVAPLRGSGPQAIVAAVVAAVHAFCGDATPIDDLTIVAVRYDG